MFILLSLLGFPLALVMAWIFDATPDGVKFDPGVSGSKRVFAVAAVLIALALAWYFRGQPALRGDEPAKPAAIAQAPVPAAAPAISEKSIAVLPFVDMSQNKDQEYFSDGIAEELLNRLAKFPDLLVAARTSAFQFKGKNLDVAEIGRQLRVAHVLEGSVRKSGTRLRITAQLIDSKTGYHLWSETYDRDATDIFKVQDEISNAIANELEARLVDRPGAAAQARAANPAAYDDYLKGRVSSRCARVENLDKAIAAFDRAIALDPGYSPAHSGRAFAYLLRPMWNAPGSSADLPWRPRGPRPKQRFSSIPAMPRPTWCAAWRHSSAGMRAPPPPTSTAPWRWPRAASMCSTWTAISGRTWATWARPSATSARRWRSTRSPSCIR